MQRFKIYLLFIVLFSLPLLSQAQISGPGNVPTGGTYQYSYSGGGMVMNPQWGLQNNRGSITATGGGSGYYTATITWNTVGSDILYFMDGSNIVAQMNITVSQGPPPVPTATAAGNITSSSFTAYWNNVPSAYDYRLDVSTSSTFSNFVSGYSNKVVNTTASPVSGLASNTVYYYRVKSANSAGSTSLPSNVISLRTKLSTPTSLAASAVGHNSFTVSWSGDPGATSFEVQIDDNTSFSSPSPVNMTSSPLTFSSLSALTTYYVRIKAINSYGESAFSTTLSVTTTPNPPTVSAATNIASTSFTANWGWVTNATSYLLDVSTASDFSSFVSGYSALSVGAVNTYSVTGLSGGTTYYYRLRAYNPSWTTGYSSTISVLTPPATPTANAASSLTTTSFTANWSGVTGASTYYLDVSTSSSFSSFVVNNRSVASTSSSVTGLSAGTTYYYRVRASNTAGTSANSGTITVLTLPAAPTANAATSIATTSFTANWTAVTGASGYRLDVSTSSSFSSFVSGYNNLTVSGTSRSVTGLSSGTTYYYRVRAVNASGASTSSTQNPSALLKPAAPVAAAASAHATTSFTANWSAATGAASYRIDVSTSNTFSNFVSGYNNLTVTGISKSVTGLSPGTRYYYRLRAVNASGTSGNSSTITTNTTLAAPAAAAPTIVASNSFVAEWPAVTGATSYRLDVSTSNTFASFVSGYNNLTVTGTNRDVTGLTTGTTYYFRVRAVNSVTTSGNSATIPVVVNGLFGGMDANYVVTNAIKVEGITSETAVASLQISNGAQTIQYLDGLGRPLQTVATQASPSMKDIVSPHAYDLLGRENKGYIPYAHGTQANGLLKTEALPTTDRPFSETIFDTSPLSRPLRNIGPGAAWYTNQTTNKAIVHGYLANNSASESVISWTLNGSGMPVRSTADGTYVLTNGYYASNQLAIKSTKDEEGREVRTYTDKQGRLVMKKVQYVATPTLSNRDHWAQTYYVYDAYGRLRYEFTPTLAHLVHQNNTYVPTQAELDRLAFQYTYDNLDRMITSKSPGTGVVSMVYDNWDRLVMTQDAVQKPAKQWTFTKYDYLHRPVITGLYTHGTDVDRETMQGLVVTGNETYNGVNTDQGYSKAIFPTSNFTILSATYYDNYSFKDMVANSNDDYLASDLTGLPTSNFTRTAGLVTGSRTNILGTSTYLWGVTYYDDYQQPIQSIFQNHLGGYDRLSTIYDFTGKTTKSKTTHVTSSGTTVVNKRFEFDHAGRLKRAYHKVNSEPEVALAEYVYNEKGEVAERNLHVPNLVAGGAPFTQNGTTVAHTLVLDKYSGQNEIIAVQSITLQPGVHIKAKSGSTITLKTGEAAANSAAQQAAAGLQSVDYSYNVRGWVQGINSSNLTPGSNEPDDFFGVNLEYNTNSVSMGNTVKYDGNITAMRYSANLGLDVTKEKGYIYTYDPLSRLTTANYKEGGASTWANPTAWEEKSITYDRNGNIKALIRSNGTGNATDNLTYTYESTNGNKLLKVDDAVTTGTDGFIDGANTGNDYAYDANGNLLQDLNKNIPANGIEYNHLNLPKKVTITGLGYFVFTYDASGRKLKQEFFNPSNQSQWYYNYDGEFVYKGSTLQFIRHEEGRYVPAGKDYQYELTDHLGNTRMIFTSDTEAVNATATMETAKAAAEQAEFLYHNEAVKINSTLFDHTNAGGSWYSTRLTGSTQERTGLAKSLAVLPGDVIKAEVYVKYLDPNSNNWTAGLANLINSIAAGTAPAGTFVDGGAAGSTGGATAPYLNVLNKGGETGTAPKAYLNWLVFDENVNPIAGQSSFMRVSTAAREYGQNAAHERLHVEITITKPGFVYLYLSNDNVALGGSPVEVYFDDFNVVHEAPVVQMQDFYPFGLVYNSYLREDARSNRFLYQGKERMDTLGHYDFHARWYSAETGRFLTVDPKNQFASGYVGMGNNPVMGVDPDGQWVNLAMGAVAGGVSSYIAGRKAGLRGWDLAGATFGGAAIGMISGGVGIAVGQSILAAGASSVVAAGVGGVAAGFTGGYFGAAQSGGNTLDGAWKGAVAGFAGGSIAAAVSGSGGAFLGGAAAGATSSALNGGDLGDMVKAAAFGGGLAFGMYYASASLKFGKKANHTEFDAEPNKTKHRMSRVSQKIAAFRREYGFSYDKNGDFKGIKRGVFEKPYDLAAMQRRVLNGKYPKFIYNNRASARLNNRVAHIFEGDRLSYHGHTAGGDGGFSTGNDADIFNYNRYHVSNAFMSHQGGSIYHWSFASQTQTIVGPTNEYLMGNYLFEF